MAIMTTRIGVGHYETNNGRMRFREDTIDNWGISVKDDDHPRGWRWIAWRASLSDAVRDFGTRA